MPLITPLAQQFHPQSLLSVGAILTLAQLMSENRRAFPIRTVIAGFAMQVVLALLLLKVLVAREGLFALNGVVGALTEATRTGTSFVFGVVDGGDAPFKVANSAGMVNFAFGALPLIVVISALSALLSHWRVMSPGSAATDTVAESEMKYRSGMDAVSHGTEVGLKMFRQIIAMLGVVVALVALANMTLANLPSFWGAPITLKRVFGWLFVPVVWLYGVPWNEAALAGSFLGTKTILNELIAYIDLVALPAGALDPVRP